MSRALIVSWRDQPTRHDIEALQANIRRVGLVVRVRWMLIFVLIVYSILAGLAYSTHIEPSELAALMIAPAFSLGFVLLYNTFYARNYRRLGNIAVWNNLQLALDALVVTVLVYFSGGVNSWFWTMYALFILEAALILPRSRDTWFHALLSIALLGAVGWSEFLGVLPHIRIPFSGEDYYRDFVFVSVRYLWQVTVLAGTAAVATLMIGQFRGEHSTGRSQRIVDELTGLFSRMYFMRALAAEVRRAEQDERALHVMLIDIDRFGEFNEHFGIDAGDRMLRSVAEAIAEAVAPAGDIRATTNVAARYGGEEFSILLAEDERLQGAPSTHDALTLAGQIRETVATVVVDGACVTVSVGVSSSPLDGRTADELVDAADTALICAVEEGGNRVVAAADCVRDDESQVPE